MNERIRVLEVPPPGARGPAYIAPPNERGPSDQTDLNRTVFLNPLGRWSMIREAEPHWLGEAGAQSPGLLGLPLVPMASRLLWMIENRRTR